ncbi:MAG TPA: thiol:disulfide interchange protein DsbA/DsbL [Steroidobacteraceae bacterium]|nr:thiol:disulfide interchange protein DsbA/DsbL [Steroidobacteraceae bacterium]
MSRFTLLAVATLILTLPLAGRGATWTEGVQYARLTPPQQTSVGPGKVEVLEVFSYGCPACNAFQPVMERMRHVLPANAQLVFLPAAFNPQEDWPMFQRAYLAAQALGIAERTHQAMYDAVWKTGELGIIASGSNRLKDPLPSIADAARFYARVGGVDAQKFLAMANSFSIDGKMRAADAQIMAMHVDATPTLIVNGKYRVIRNELSNDQVLDLVKYLVAKEGGSESAPAGPAHP